MTKDVFALLIGLSAALTAPSAYAQTSNCADRDAIVQRLETKYGETRQSAGLNQQNGMVEVFASSQTGTWTILMTLPTGKSCLMAAGDSWQGYLAQLPGEDA